MTARLIAYGVLAALLIGLGYRLGGMAPKSALAAYKAEVAAYVIAEANTATQAAIAAKATQDAANAHNRQVQDALQTKLAASAAAGLTFARRLRDAEAAASAARRELSQAAGGREPTGASGESGPSALDVAVADDAAESQRNADRLDAVIAEIKPQL